MSRKRTVPVVTTLTRPQQDRLRLQRYLSIMSVAICCFVTAPWLPGPLQVVAIVLSAGCLPAAAIVANQPRRRITIGQPVQDARLRHPEQGDLGHRVIDPDR